MDMSWTRSSRNSREYFEGVYQFVEVLRREETLGDKIRCACKRCKSVRFLDPNEVKAHLLSNGIDSSRIPIEESHSNEGIDDQVDDIQGLLKAALGKQNIPESSLDEDQIPIGTLDEDQIIIDEDMSDEDIENDFIHIFASEELYPGCKFTTLSFIVKLFHIKVLSGWSQKSFKMLLDLLGQVLPDGHKLPKKFSQCQKIIRDLGLEYTKIDVCRNNCVLYWKDNSLKSECPTCGRERWTQVGNKQIAEKTMRYFPLKPRLQRLFMSNMTAKDMRWHHDECNRDNIMRHPRDSEAWKNFDQLHPNFASDARNVRLGLASDGMNPYGNMSISYSVWPVILIPYNLPPWVCMKQHNFILSMIIPGKGAPGNDIDVYLQPLVEELKELWADGVKTYDAFTRSHFILRAALIWTINDFPAYANLSGWSTKGKLSCPICNKNFFTTSLKYGGKQCWIGSRMFICNNHKWRSWRKAFNGAPERRPPPKRLSGLDELRQLEHLPTISFGNRTRDDKPKKLVKYLGWTKKSIFFDLPYWRTNLLRHNLDVMHIEKNISENILSTLMNIKDKTKDCLKARLDLEKMGIRNHLHPYKYGERYRYPPAAYVLDVNQQSALCKFLVEVKFPDSYASNISRRVNLQERKIMGFKSHDYHVLLQQLLPIAARDLLPSNISEPLIEIGNFFKELCSKTLQLDVIEKLGEKIALTLCKLEMIFPPSFFVCMMHLPLHLVEEVKLGGPVQYRWMYPIERYLYTLKKLMKNRARPEGSIAEGYIAEECLTFCSRYLRGIETKFNRPERNDDGGQQHNIGSCLSIFATRGRGVAGGHRHTLSDIEINQIQYYVLHNCPEVDPYLAEHKDMINRSSIANPLLGHEAIFATWFKQRALQHDVSIELKEIASGPNRDAFLYDTFNVNGYRFSTESSQLNRRTQNYGVQVSDSHINYYGVLQQIVEVPYQGSKWVVLFKCKWYDVENERGYKLKDGIESINVTRSAYSDQPYVLASQATQVFYIKEVKDTNWHVVVKTQPRSYYNMSSVENVDSELQDDNEPYQQEENDDDFDHSNAMSFVNDEELLLVRNDIPHLEEEAP